MKKNLSLVVMMVWSCSVLFGQDTWVKVFGGSGYGGSGDDSGESIITTPDGGYVLTGVTNSNDGDFKGMNKGGRDIFVIKLDSRGDVQWKKTIGSSEYDRSNSITTAPDGGCVLTGLAASYDGDFNGINKGGADIFVIKLDSRGDVQWKKTFGGLFLDDGRSITTTPDGGFVLTGYTYANYGDFEGMNQGEWDIFVIKLDSRGSVEWKKTFGGTGGEEGNSITTSPDGGYVLTGVTSSNDGDFEGMNKGEKDIFVIKLNSRGDVEWKKAFGGTGGEEGYSITTSPDGGFVLTGSAYSNDGDFNGMNKGEWDIFIIKLESHGDVQWKKTIGGLRYEKGHSVTITLDDGYILTGGTQSNDGDFNGMNKGESDIFVIKLDSHGDVQWKKTFGGLWGDDGRSIATTPDGGFVLTGNTYPNDGDFKGMYKVDRDIFVIKLDSYGNLNPNSKKSKKK